MMFGGYGGGGRNRGGGIGALLMLFLAPFAAMLLQLGISRQREYQADASGVQMVGHANGLISALEKLGAYNKRIPMDIPPSTSALCIVRRFSRANAFGPVQHASAARGSHCGAAQHDHHARTGNRQPVPEGLVLSTQSTVAL